MRGPFFLKPGDAFERARHDAGKGAFTVGLRLDQIGQPTADDTDFEAYSPAKFLSLVAEVQTVALDMLFAPDTMLLGAPHPVWAEIKALAPRLFSRRTSAFVGYCRQQARKFGLKGERLAAVRAALDGLRAIEAIHGSNAKLEVAATELHALAAEHALLGVVEVPEATGYVATYFDIAVKRYCYALRQALMLMWLNAREELPPMDVNGLSNGLNLAEEVLAAMAGLFAHKRFGGEKDAVEGVAVLDTLIENALRDEAPRPDRIDIGAHPLLQEADALFRSLIND